MGALVYRDEVFTQLSAPSKIRWGHRLANKLVLSTFNSASDWLQGPVNYCNNKPATVNTAITSAKGPLGYDTVPKGNGTTTIAKNRISFAPFRQMSFSWWAYWDANANNDQCIWGYGTTNWVTDSGILVDPNEASGSYTIGLSEGSLAHFSTTTYARPTAAAWHHFALTMDRNVASTHGIQFYIDGALKSISGGSSTLLGGTDFGATQDIAFFGARSGGGAQLFGAGRMACFNAWGGRILNRVDIEMMRANSMQILEGYPQIVGVPAAAATNMGRWFLCQ